MKVFKVLKYNNIPKFIICNDEPLLKIDSLYYLNVLSFLKATFTLLLTNKVKPKDIKSLINVEFISTEMINEASEIILGEEVNYKKATLINKNKKRVFKYLIFNCDKDANTFKINFTNLYQLKIKHFSKLNTPNFKIEKLVNITLVDKTLCIESVYQENLKKIGLFDLFTFKNFIHSYYYAYQSSGVIHGDFKIYNIRKTKKNTYFLFDLESLLTHLTEKEFLDTLLLPHKQNIKISLTALIFYNVLRQMKLK